MTGTSDTDESCTDAREPRGLTQAEAAQRRERVGPNSVPEPRSRPLLAFMRKLNGPVPWMLEAALALEIAQGKAVEAAIVAILLLFNAALSFVQEHAPREHWSCSGAASS